MSEENNHIEQFFKKHLEVEQTSFMEEDWLKMEAKLDAAGASAPNSIKRGIGIRKGLIILLLATTFAFILGWFLRDVHFKDDTSTSTQKSDRTKDAPPAVSNSKSTTNLADSLATHKEPIAGFSDEGSNDPISSVISSNSDTSALSDSQESDNSKKEDGNHLLSHKEIEGTNNQDEIIDQHSVSQTNINISSLTAQTNGSEQSVDEQPSFEKSIDADEKEDYEQDEHIISKPIPRYFVARKQPNLKEYFYNSLPNAENTLTQYLTGQMNCPSAPQSFNWKRFAIGLAWAPDFNSLNFKREAKVTNKLGLRLFWKPLTRFEIQSGIFFNRKKYVSPGEEYHPPAGYWGQQTNGIVPDWVNGSCAVIDIPVTIGFDVIQTKRWNWSINGGLSNYILLDEIYSYEFEKPNPDAVWGWETGENTTLNWSVMNASIGGEFLWRSKTSLKIEPFIQMPLQDIGWASVSLYGYGVLFTVKQNLLTNNR